MNSLSIETSGDLGVNAKSFVRHLRASNLSPATIKTYAEATRLLAEFLTDKGMPTDLANIRREHLEVFVEDQLDRWKPATAANRFGGIRAFFNWAVEDGEIKSESNPMANMRPPKVPEHSVPVLSVDNIKKLLNGCRGNDFASRRDMAILRVFLTTGARRSEVANLRFSPDHPELNDIDLDGAFARVQGKGGRDRPVPLEKGTVLALDRYFRVRRKHSFTESNWLWLGKRGRLTTDGIRQMLERRAASAGIGKVHLHQLRHSYAHYFLADGGGETDLMRIAGWRSQDMVRRYANSTGEERALVAGRKFGLADRI
jgi:site-specific recombinase XerD